MRLIRIEDGAQFSLVEFIGKNSAPPYAILSHTWGEDHDEVTLRDLVNGTGQNKSGYTKIGFCGRQTAKDGLKYFWIDTCCIDKSSSAELSEAINSMYRWYRNAARCYVYLSDVSVSGSVEDQAPPSSMNDLGIKGSVEDQEYPSWINIFKRSRWFTRGWTLQELIAPISVEFFSKDEQSLGNKHLLERVLYEVTKINVQALRGSSLSQFTVEERISWAENRQTKREEDAAYSLLGIFDIHMPLIYGEGEEKALNRLHKEIRKSLKGKSPMLPLRSSPDSLNQRLERMMPRLEEWEKKTINELLDSKQRAMTDLANHAKEKADLEEKIKYEQLAKEELQERYTQLKTKSEKDTAVLKSVIGNQEAESATIQTIVSSVETDKAKQKRSPAFWSPFFMKLKSKGDIYFSTSFSELEKRILDFADTYFDHTPLDLSPGDFSQLPSEGSMFLGDTKAARQLRAAYITHIVSKRITDRVFQPFLFSRNRDYDGGNLLESMSHHIRSKGPVDESIWRQLTLLSAFTSEGAKQRINNAAGTVVQDIVSAVKKFADTEQEENIRIAVRKIIRLAAETWRFARLERELITASFPTLEHNEHAFTGPEYWPKWKPKGSADSSPTIKRKSSDNTPRLILRLFPVIVRESRGEAFCLTYDEEPDQGCVYNHGLALYDDAEPVLQRKQELELLGLPSTTPPPSEHSRSKSPSRFLSQ